MNKRNSKKQVIWQDIVPVQKPKNPWQKFIFRIKKLKKSKKPARPAPHPRPSQPKSLHYDNLNSKKIKKQHLKCRLKPKKRLIIITAGLLIIILISIVYFTTIHNSKASLKNDIKTTDTTKKLVKSTPKFKTIIPAGKNIKDLGGWTRVSPADSDPVFAYVDKIGNISINVSQQPLPTDFETDTDSQLEQLAQSFKASEKISVGAYTIHIGTSAEGPQSVIFSKNGLLILIKSASKIDNNSWAQYINSLQ